MLLLQLILWVQIGAVEFEVEGELITSIHRPDGTVTKELTSRFEIGVANHTWKGKAIYGSNYYQAFGCDGTNVFSYLVDPNPHVTSGTNMPVSIPGTVTSGVYPSSATHYITIPWFALASCVFYESNLHAIPAPWYASQMQPEAHFYKVATSRFIDSQATISNATFYIDTSRGNALGGSNSVIPTANTLEKRSEALEFARGMGDGIQGEYQVVESRVFNDVRIPTLFNLEQYLPAPGGKKFVYVKYVGRIDQIRIPEWESPLPKIQTPVDVFDYRFMDQQVAMNGISYTISNEWHVDENEPVLRDLFQRSRSAYFATVRENRILRKALRVVTVAAVVLVVLAPPILMIRRAWKGNKQMRSS